MSDPVTYDDVKYAFRKAHDTLEEAIAGDASDGNYADLAGLMREEAAYAASQKRALVSEIPADVQVEGGEYKLYQPEVTTRTFSTDKLLMDLLFHSDAGLGFVDMIRELIDAKVFKLTWNWTNLKKEAYKKQMSLIVAPHAIDDVDVEAHVGEVKSTGSAQFSPVKDAPPK